MERVKKTIRALRKLWVRFLQVYHTGFTMLTFGKRSANHVITNIDLYNHNGPNLLLNVGSVTYTSLTLFQATRNLISYLEIDHYRKLTRQTFLFEYFVIYSGNFHALCKTKIRVNQFAGNNVYKHFNIFYYVKIL